MLYSHLNYPCSTVNVVTRPMIKLSQGFDLVTINTMHWLTHDAERMRHQSICIKLCYSGIPINEIKKAINEVMKGTSASSPQKKTTIQIAILSTYGQTDGKVKYCILVAGDFKNESKSSADRLLDQQDQQIAQH